MTVLLESIRINLLINLKFYIFLEPASLFATYVKQLKYNSIYSVSLLFIEFFNSCKIYSNFSQVISQGNGVTSLPLPMTLDRLILFFYMFKSLKTAYPVVWILFKSTHTYNYCNIPLYSDTQYINSLK